MLAVILAGGKGSRFGNHEKCLIRICDRAIIEHVINVVEEFCSRIIVATSLRHSGIIRFCRENNIDFLITTGRDLCYDMCMIVNVTRDRPLIFFPCDIVIARDVVRQVFNIALSAEPDVCITFVDENGKFTGISVVTYDRCVFGVDFRWRNVKLCGQVYDVDTIEDVILLRSLLCQ